MQRWPLRGIPLFCRLQKPDRIKAWFGRVAGCVKVGPSWTSRQHNQCLFYMKTCSAVARQSSRVDGWDFPGCFEVTPFDVFKAPEVEFAHTVSGSISSAWVSGPRWSRGGLQQQQQPWRGDAPLSPFWFWRVYASITAAPSTWTWTNPPCTKDPNEATSASRWTSSSKGLRRTCETWRD